MVLLDGRFALNTGAFLEPDHEPAQPPARFVSVLESASVQIPLKPQKYESQLPAGGGGIHIFLQTAKANIGRLQLLHHLNQVG